MKPEPLEKITYRDVVKGNYTTRFSVGRRIFIGEFHNFLINFFATLIGTVVVIVFIAVT